MPPSGVQRNASLPNMGSVKNELDSPTMTDPSDEMAWPKLRSLPPGRSPRPTSPDASVQAKAAGATTFVEFAGYMTLYARMRPTHVDEITTLIEVVADKPRRTLEQVQNDLFALPDGTTVELEHAVKKDQESVRVSISVITEVEEENRDKELRKRRLEPSPAGVRWWVVVAAAWVEDVQERLKTLEAKAAQDGQSLVDRLLDRDDHNKVCYHHATSPEKSVSSRSFLLSPTRAGPD